MPAMSKILVNGAEREVAVDLSVAALIEELGLRPEQVAVELNERLVPKAKRAEVLLADGDRVEVVTMVGGG